MLEMDDISKRFGATRALNRVSLRANRGEVLALIGENGAGKSTLMKVLSGAHAPDSGRILLNGAPYAPQGPHDARAAGVGMIYQELNLAPDLTVEDNIMLGMEHARGGWLRRRSQRDVVRRALDVLGHSDLRPDAIAGELSVGAQQLVEIARAIALDAQVVVFDEPTSSLPLRDVEQLFRVIDRLRHDGRAVVYISHFLEEVRRVADRYTVLRDGETAGDGRLDDVTDDDIVSLMVGRSVEELFPQVPHEIGEPILQLKELHGPNLPTGVSLELHRGEILGIAGLVGAGRTELLRCVFGLDKVVSGQLAVSEYAGHPKPHNQIETGLGFVSEDRKSEGLAQSLSIADNVVLNHLSPYSSFGWLNLRKVRRSVGVWSDELSVKARSSSQPVETLSGGNQQKVAIARILHQQADVLLLDEPTRGIDVGTKSQIYRLIGESAAAGKAIIFVSSYLPELMAMCDRIGVMQRGLLQDIRYTKDWTEEQIMSQAVGA